MTRISISLRQEDADKIKLYAYKAKTSKSDFIRSIVLDYIKNSRRK